MPGAGVAEIPDKIPEPIPIEAIAGMLLIHVPPAGLPVSVVVEPSHTCIGVPLILVGFAFTSITMVRAHPEDNV